MFYDKNARSTSAEQLRCAIDIIADEIDRMAELKNQVGDTCGTLAIIEATLCRMSMLAREVLRSGKHRPGLVEEFELCKRRVRKLSAQTSVETNIFLRRIRQVI
jgi:hypothetical protein